MIENLHSDDAIVSMIIENKPQGWDLLYDKFAPMMYGAILSITDNFLLAQNILMQCFLELKNTEAISGNPKTLQLKLLHHAYKTAINIARNTNRLQGSKKDLNQLFFSDNNNPNQQQTKKLS